MSLINCLESAEYNARRSGDALLAAQLRDHRLTLHYGRRPSSLRSNHVPCVKWDTMAALVTTICTTYAVQRFNLSEVHHACSNNHRFVAGERLSRY